MEEKPTLRFLCSEHGEQGTQQLTTLGISLDCGCVFYPAKGEWSYDRNDKIPRVNWEKALKKREEEKGRTQKQPERLKSEEGDGRVVERKSSYKREARATPLSDEDWMPFGKFGPDEGDPRKMKDVPAWYLDSILDREWIRNSPRVEAYILSNASVIEKELFDE